MKKNKKIVITVALAIGMLVFFAVVFFIDDYKKLENTFIEEGIEDQNTDNTSEKSEDSTETNAGEDSASEENNELSFDYESTVLETDSGFTKIKVTWDSLNSRKENNEIYLRTKIGSVWGEWFKYNLDLDPATRNSTYTTGELSLSGDNFQYAFNFNEDEFVKGVLFEMNGSEEILVDEVSSE